MPQDVRGDVSRRGVSGSGCSTGSCVKYFGPKATCGVEALVQVLSAAVTLLVTAPMPAWMVSLRYHVHLASACLVLQSRCLLNVSDPMLFTNAKQWSG